jgi:hypothetical protein
MPVVSTLTLQARRSTAPIDLSNHVEARAPPQHMYETAQDIRVADQAPKCTCARLSWVFSHKCWYYARMKIHGKRFRRTPFNLPAPAGQPVTDCAEQGLVLLLALLHIESSSQRAFREATTACPSRPAQSLDIWREGRVLRSPSVAWLGGQPCSVA